MASNASATDHRAPWSKGKIVGTASEGGAPTFATPQADEPRVLPELQAKSVLKVVGELEDFHIKPNDYYDDPEPRAFLDDALTGLLKTVRAYCDASGWERLSIVLKGILPVQGDALENLELIQSYIAPELRRLVVVPLGSAVSSTPLARRPVWGAATSKRCPTAFTWSASMAAQKENPTSSLAPSSDQCQDWMHSPVHKFLVRRAGPPVASNHSAEWNQLSSVAILREVL